MSEGADPAFDADVEFLEAAVVPPVRALDDPACPGLQRGLFLLIT